MNSVFKIKKMSVKIQEEEYNLILSDEKKCIDVKDEKQIHMILKMIHRSTKLLDVAKFSIKCQQVFDFLPSNPILLDIVDIWIYKLRKITDIWKRITLLKDYNLQKFQRRTFPYFRLDKKDWKAVSMQDYPKEISRDFEEVDDSDEEPEVFSNNFKSFDIKENSSTEHMNGIILILQYIKKLDDIPRLNEASLFLMMNPKTAHIIAEPSFWKLLSMDVEDMQIFNYAMFYAMYILRHEDTTLFSKVSKRTLWTHAQYTALPVIWDTIELNPYVTSLVNKKYITQRTPWYLSDKREFTTKQEFHSRLHYITGGCLDGVDLKKYNACIAGSILYPCIVKSPLEKNFRGLVLDIPNFWWNDKILGDDSSFLQYMEFYYPSYASLLDDDLKNEHRRPEDCITDGKIPHEAGDKKNRIIKKKSDLILTDIDIAISTRSFQVFIDSVFGIFKDIKSRCSKPVYLKKVNTKASFKFAISGPGIMRPIEIFRVYCTHAKMTKKFHMPNVRAYFDGIIDQKNPTMERLRVHRSFISAAVSGINECYKWFSCNKIPLDTIFKNIQRGISIPFNDKELETAKKYLETNGKWHKMTIGQVNRKHIFFSDSKKGIRRGLREMKLGYTNINTTSSVKYKPTMTTYGKILTTRNNISVKIPNADIIRSYIEHKKEMLMLEKM